MCSRVTKTQSMSEYALFIAAVIVGLLSMHIYYHRAVKKSLKDKSDTISTPWNFKDGGYIYESKSIAGRDIRAGFTKQDDNVSWQRARIYDSDHPVPDTDFITEQVDTQLIEDYIGGEISSSNYADRFDTTEKSGPGVADLGSIQSKDTLWQDAGLED